LDPGLIFTLIYGGTGVLLLLIVILSRRARRHGGAFRAGVVGAVYEWQNKDKQRALDVIVEGKAAETRPEYPEGDLPQLESPTEDSTRRVCDVEVRQLPQSPQTVLSGRGKRCTHDI
jgi:hypothetical protein